jgi:hypothetical protein
MIKPALRLGILYSPSTKLVASSIDSIRLGG